MAHGPQPVFLACASDASSDRPGCKWRTSSVCRAWLTDACWPCALTPRPQASLSSPSSSSQLPQPSGRALRQWAGHRCRRRCGTAVSVSAAAARLRRCCTRSVQTTCPPQTHCSAHRLNVVTGDPQVLASVGSLLIAGPLALALLPLHASAAGAAVVRQGPVFLAEEGRQATDAYGWASTQWERHGLALKIALKPLNCSPGLTVKPCPCLMHPSELPRLHPHCPSAGGAWPATTLRVAQCSACPLWQQGSKPARRRRAAMV